MKWNARWTPIALATVLHNKTRFFAVVAGVGCSILLLFLQPGFYDACRRSSTMVFELFDFDAVVVGNDYHLLNDSGRVALRRLQQAEGMSWVESVAPVFFQMAEWRQPGDPRTDWTAVVGVRPADQFFRGAELGPTSAWSASRPAWIPRPAQAAFRRGCRGTSGFSVGTSCWPVSEMAG